MTVRKRLLSSRTDHLEAERRRGESSGKQAAHAALEWADVERVRSADLTDPGTPGWSAADVIVRATERDAEELWPRECIVSGYPSDAYVEGWVAGVEQYAAEVEKAE